MANLGNPQETIAVLQRYGFNFQKKYGQNFLIDMYLIRLSEQHRLVRMILCWKSVRESER